MEIDIINDINDLRLLIPKKCIEWFVSKILYQENIDDSGEISILFTTNERIRTLNLEYRKIDAPTNVLSFSMREGLPVPFDNILGDVVISIEYAESEANEMKIPMEDRVIQLIIHGILHLLGYDHITDEEYNIMNKKEIFYFELWRKEKNKCLKMRN